MKNAFKLFIPALAIGLVLSSCGSKETKSTDASETTAHGEIKIDGSSTVYPITEAVAEEFRTEQPDVKGYRRRFRDRWRISKIRPRRNGY